MMLCFRYDDVSELRQIFTDVFPCYLEDKFPVQKGGTMFRFPLRTPEMASDSELSEQIIGVDLVETLLNKFKGEMLDCLLFVNNVKTIAIHQVSYGEGNVTFNATPNPFLLNKICFQVMLTSMCV